MKRIVSNAQVAHLWANQSQTEASNAGGSIFFHGAVIYSYGSHFPMARHVDGAVLVNNSSYSVTTAKHQMLVRSAIRHLPSFDVVNCMADSPKAHASNFDDYRQRYENTLLKASRARVYADSLMNDAERLRNECNQYVEAFELVQRLEVGNVDDIKERAANQKASEKRRRARELAEQRIAYDESVAVWRLGESNHVKHAHSFPIALRLIDYGNVVQSSWGALCPVDDARLGVTLAKRCQRKSETWRRNGQRLRLGSFQLDSVSATGEVKAGCHTISFVEVLHLETLLAQGGA